MASPFKVFRKHQKLMLAVLTLLTMFSFVFLGYISDLLGNRKQQNPVMVSTSKYGKLRGTDVYFMRQDRLKLLGVLSRIHSAALMINPESSYKMLESTFGAANDENLVNTWLKSRRAEELGMVVSDQTVNEFLQGVSQNRLKSSDISAIIRQGGLTEGQFFNILREELLAFKLTQLFEWSLQGITPAQRWEYFCQLQKRASVELIPVDVEQFLAQVKDPSDEDLKAFFEKYKEKLNRPDSPEPGFRKPHTIEVQYVKADITKFSDPSKITDEEIQKTYEKYRDQFDAYEKAVEDALKSQQKAAAATDTKEAAPAGEKAPEQPKEQPAEEQKPTEKPSAPEEKAPAEDANKSSAVERSPFRLTAFAEESTAGKPAADQPAPDKPAADQPAADAPKAEKPLSDQTAQPKEAEKAKGPLSEKMKERIRAIVAREKIAALFASTSPLSQSIDESSKKWRKYEADLIQNKKVEPPASLDFDAMAKQYDLTAGQTGVISAWEAQKFDIGASMVDRATPFTIAAFKSLSKFKPVVSMDAQGNEYLFWKIKDAPEAAASWDDQNTRAAVLHAWKLIQARELARKAAEGVAETARRSNTTLKEAFSANPQVQVIAPPPFTMRTEGSIPRGSSPMPPRLNAVEGVPMVGLDFMNAVFKLEQGQIGIAMNAPQTVVFVVQPVSYSPSREVLWKIFLAEDFNKYASVAVIEIEADRKAWLESLKTYAGLKWEIKPEQQQADYAPEEMPLD